MSGIMNMFVAAKTTIATAVDEFFNRVTLLLNTGSTNGAQNNTFLDSSSNAFSITRNGNTTQGTFTPFSQTGWSNYFDGSSYLNVGTSGQSDFNFPAPSGSTNNFCIELWFYATGTLSATTYTALVGCHDGVDSSSWSTFVRSNGVFIYGSTNTFTGGGTVNSNAWNHAVFVRSADNVSVYLNGSRVDTQIRSGAYNNTSDLLHIGDDNSGTNPPFTGYISNVRILKGSSAAIYSGTTITVPTAPLTTVTGTVLLSSQSNRFVDNSSVASSITVGAGTPSVQAFSPFPPLAAYDTAVVGGSGYFDGTGDYLVFGSGQANANLNGNCSIELWFYPTGAAAAGLLTAKYGGTTNQFYVNSQSNNLIYCEFLGSTFYAKTSSGSFTRNAWNHLLITKSGTTAKMWLNGVYEGAWTVSTTNSSTDAIGVGATQGGATTFSGYISGIRYSNTATETGTSNITLPTAPLTSNGNTAALLGFTNAGIYDAAAKNDLETIGNAQVSTTQAKFGTTSMSFNGSGNGLQFPSNQLLNVGTGDFTIECWAYVSDLSTYRGVFQISGTAGGYSTTITNSLGMDFKSGGTGFEVYAKGASNQVTYSVSTNTWYYLAIVRSGTTTTFYVNGTSQATYTADSTNYNGTYLGIGNIYSGAYPFSGYMDEFRITRYARTISASPTAAFPVQ